MTRRVSQVTFAVHMLTGKLEYPPSYKLSVMRNPGIEGELTPDDTVVMLANMSKGSRFGLLSLVSISTHHV